MDGVCAGGKTVRLPWNRVPRAHSLRSRLAPLPRQFSKPDGGPDFWATVARSVREYGIPIVIGFSAGSQEAGDAEIDEFVADSIGASASKRSRGPGSTKLLDAPRSGRPPSIPLAGRCQVVQSPAIESVAVHPQDFSSPQALQGRTAAKIWTRRAWY